MVPVQRPVVSSTSSAAAGPMTYVLFYSQQPPGTRRAETPGGRAPPGTGDAAAASGGAPPGRNGRRGAPRLPHVADAGAGARGAAGCSLSKSHVGRRRRRHRGARGVNLLDFDRIHDGRGRRAAAPPPCFAQMSRDARALPVFGALLGSTSSRRCAISDSSRWSRHSRRRLKAREQHAQKVPEIRVAVLHHLLALLLDEVAAHARGRRVRGIDVGEDSRGGRPTRGRCSRTSRCT